MKCTIIKNIPNILTFSRLIASVAGATFFVLGNIPAAIWLYVYGAVSDFLDGFAARKLNAFSEFGRKLDAFSDKLYAGSLLIPSILCGNLLMIVPLLMELKISFINLKAEKLGFKPATQRIGKFKTATLFPTIIVGLLATLSPEFYFLLYPLLIMTSILQEKTITVYENELVINEQRLAKNTSVDKVTEVDDFFINSYDLDKGLVHQKKKASLKYAYVYKAKDLSDEWAFYLTSPYYPSNKLVRKK